MRRVLWAVLLLSVVVVVLPPEVAADVQPSPGHLLVTNNLQAPNCSGSVRFHYGFLPQQAQRAFVAEISPTCGLNVTQMRSEDPAPWRPVGHVEVHAAASSRVGQESLQYHDLWQGYYYGLIPCPPEPIGVESTYWTDSSWNEGLGPTYGGGPCEPWTNLAAWRWIGDKQRHLSLITFATMSGTGCDFESDTFGREASITPYCNPGSPTVRVPHIRTPADPLGTVAPGTSATFTVGAS